MPKPARKPAAPPAAPLPAATPTPPAPFTAAAPPLRPFLAHLDPAQAYIVHIDPLPWRFKRRIFYVPLALNLVLAGLLAWRAYAAAPAYWRVLLGALGGPTGAAADAAALSWGRLVRLVLTRAGVLAVDFLLVRVVALWPLTFFLEGPGNPVRWRWGVGFRDQEVVVRVSRGWGAADVLKGEAVAENAFWKVRVLPAVDRAWIRGKTGYVMMGKDWDLDFALMVTATRLVDKGEMRLDNFQKTVLVHSPRDGWLAWRAYDEDEGSEEEGRKKIVAFKDRLTAMGKENLFFRWVELIQYESSQPGGFTAARQEQAVEKARQLFTEQGVDFEEFAAAVGGVQEMPGMERRA